MKLFKISLVLAAVSIFGISFINSSSSGNSNPRTGAPNESTCTSCHGGTSLQTSGTKYNKITFNSNWTGNGYIPDSTYTITLGYKESGKSKFGFMVTSLDINDEAAGTFTSLNNRTSAFNSTVNGKTRYYIEHTNNGTSSVSTDSASWTFEWTAPSKQIGDVTFYVALNVTNNNGGTSGDVIYNKKFSISPSTLLPVAEISLADSVACTGKKITFNGKSTQSGTGFSWRFPGGAPSTSTNQNPEIQYPSTGSKVAYLTTTNTKGSSIEDTFNFTVNIGASKPSFTIFPPTLPLCKGDTGKIEVSPRTNHIYVWSTGDTSTYIPVDTAGFFTVLAIRSNGCTSLSDDFAVLETQKPKFKVSYGLLDDTNCVNEDLIILLNNQNGFADSYSLNSPIGPFKTDSFLIESINTGLNTYTIWAKGNNGCISNSDTQTFIGVDTLNAPILSGVNKYLDSVVFNWNSGINNIYQYSLDSGKSWTNIDNDSISVKLKTPSSWINFWLRYKTDYACEFSKVLKVNTQGIGCRMPNGTLSSDKLIYCLGDSVNISYNSQNPNKESIWLDGNIINKEFYFIAKNSDTITVFILDSQQLSCGYYAKSISILVDSIPEINYEFSDNNMSWSDTFYCDVSDSLNTWFTLKNTSNDTNITHTIVNSSNKSEQLFKPSTRIYPGSSGVFFIRAVNQNGCRFTSDSVNIYLSRSQNAEFQAKWVDSFLYRFTFNDRIDGNSHKIFILNDSFSIPINQDTILLNLSKYENLSLEITSRIIDSTMKNFGFEEVCQYQFSEILAIKNLKSSTIKDQSKIWYPNPVKDLSDLFCNNCDESDDVLLINSVGKMIFNGKVNKIKNNTTQLRDGVYWIITTDSQTGSVQRQVIEIIN